MAPSLRLEADMNARARVIVVLAAALAIGWAIGGCGSSSTSHPATTATHTVAAPSPTPGPAASVLSSALAANPSMSVPTGAALTAYATNICKALGKIAILGQQVGQDAYILSVDDYVKKGYTYIQARSVLNAIIFGWCPQWDALTNTPSPGA
jgi:hypothetical protein